MDLEKRVEKLERENRHLKLTGGAVLAVGVLLGAVQSQEIPDVIKAGAFEVVDGEGDTRASFSLGSGPMATLRIGNSVSGPSAVLSAGGLTFMGPLPGEVAQERPLSMAWIVSLGDRSQAMFGPFGVAARDNDAAIALLDAEGNIRSQLGVLQLKSDATGAETNYPAAVALFDAEGNVIWLAPR